MTLKKAIDILTGNIEYTINEFNQAVRLGTEAMKRIKRKRNYSPHLELKLLPGESEK